jgi:hypothetical protein
MLAGVLCGLRIKLAWPFVKLNGLIRESKQIALMKYIYFVPGAELKLTAGVRRPADFGRF